MKTLPALLLLLSLLGSTAPARATEPSFMDSVLSYFSKDYVHARNTLSFLKARARTARSLLATKKISEGERSRRLHVELNRAYDLLQDNRSLLSRDTYGTFKKEVDRARYHVVMHDLYLKKKAGAKAAWHHKVMADELASTLNLIDWIELMTGGRT
jgi:hypothetical protein